MQKTLLSPLKIISTDRTADGNLTPEARTRTLKEIKKYISRTGLINISDLADMFCVSRQTMRALIDEALDGLRDGAEVQILAQIQWCQERVSDIIKHPEKFDKDEIALQRFHSEMLGKITCLQKALQKKK